MANRVPASQPSSVCGTAFGNIIGGGHLGGVVDGANGASNKLLPNSLLIVRLAREDSPDGAVLIDKSGKAVMSVRV